MSRDMKPHRQNLNSSKKKSGGSTLIGLFCGLVVGVLAAVAVVLYIQKTPAPFNNKSPAPPTANPSAGAAPAPMLLPGKPGDPIPQNGDKPRFDFYKILPGNAEAVPDAKSADKGEKAADKTAENKPKTEKETPLKDPLYLQTGSFQNPADADNQKAKLAMMGAEASVQQVMLQEKTWYRVRLGPFKKMEEVSTTRADLAKQGIEATVVKKD